MLILGNSISTSLVVENRIEKTIYSVFDVGSEYVNSPAMEG